MLEHSIECIRAQQRRDVEIAVFLEKYPNICRTCRGMGGFYESNYPHEPDGFGTCVDCVEKTLCPRCAAKMIGDAEVCDNGHDLATEETSIEILPQTIFEEGWCGCLEKV
jgi:hypothetical protein